MGSPEGQQRVQAINPGVLSQRGWNVFQCTGEGFHRQTLPTSLALSCLLHDQRSPHVEASATADHCAGFHRKGGRAKRIIQSSNCFFNSSTISAAHVEGYKASLLPKPEAQTLSTSIKPLASISSLNDCMKSRYDSSGVRPSSVLALSAQSEMHSGFR